MVTLYVCKQHQLKCWPESFQPLSRKEKFAEFRIDDGRNFQVSDILSMWEWQPAPSYADDARGVYTGEQAKFRITHIVRGPAFGIPKDFVMMSVRKLT